jgi:hypothetical protein
MVFPVPRNERLGRVLLERCRSTNPDYVKPNANGRFPHNQNVLDSHHNHGFAATAAEDEEFRLTMANFGHGNVFRDATQDSPGKEFL